MFGRVTVAFLLLPHSSARRDTNADVIQHITHSQGQANTPRGTLAKDSHRLDPRVWTACNADSRLAVSRLAIHRLLVPWHGIKTWRSRRFRCYHFGMNSRPGNRVDSARTTLVSSIIGRPSSRVVRQPVLLRALSRGPGVQIEIAANLLLRTTGVICCHQTPQAIPRCIYQTIFPILLKTCTRVVPAALLEERA